LYNISKILKLKFCFEQNFNPIKKPCEISYHARFKRGSFILTNYLYNFNLSHYLAPNLTAINADFSTSYTWGGDVVSLGGKVAMMPIYLGTADFMVHHIHAFSVNEK
jgi:hypothetical protein